VYVEIEFKKRASPDQNFHLHRSIGFRAFVEFISLICKTWKYW